MSRRTLLGPLGLAAVLGLLAAGWTATRAGDPALRPATVGDGVTIHLLDNGFHTDLAVPREALTARPGPLAEAVRALGPGDWILIGWGDATFYVDQSPIADRLPDGARAFFRPGNASVVMLDPVARDPRRSVPATGRRSLSLSPAGFEAMARRIEASLALSGGRAMVDARRPGDDAVFLASTETFWIGHLCNHWSAEVLNAGGLAVRPFRSVTSAEVMAAIDRAELDRPGADD